MSKQKIIDKLEKEIIVAMKNLDFEKSIELDSKVKKIRDNKDNEKDM